MTIKDILNKIKWDKKENPKDYSLIYLDLGKLKEMPYTNIKRIEGTFMVIEKNNEETFIPMHRIRKVKRKGKIIWERKK